jgi:photosystem II stability/assembly factor-like uncharacterized protein
VVLRSNDGGATWYRETGVTDGAINAVAQSADARRAIAVGRGGLILVTADGGATWAERSWKVAWRFNQISMSADGMRAIASAYEGRRTLRSADGGQTWTMDTATPVGQVTLAGDGRIGLIADPRHLWPTVDGGATWSNVWPQDVRREGHLLVALSGDGRRALGFESFGPRVHSNDGGASWSLVPQQPRLLWARAALSADGSHAITTSQRNVWLSADAGATWKEVPDSEGNVAAAISADGRTAIILRTGDLPVMSTSDGGATWRRMEPKRMPPGWSLLAALAGLALLLVPAWRRWRVRDQTTGIRDQKVRA